MADLPTLHQAELGFKAASVEIPLAPFVEQAQGSNGRFASPAFAPPEVGDSLELLPRREMALRELLSHAKSGHARLCLPLPRRELKGGPLTIDLTAGHELIIDLEVVETRVSRGRTHGTIQPPIPLPLGTSFTGIYLNDNGSIIADIDKFVDINLSLWSDAVPRLPTSLDEMLEILFAERPKKPQKKPSKKEEGAGIDWSALRVEARGVTSRASAPIELGRAGQLTLGQGTRIDVDYSREELSVRGRGVIEGARLEGKGFAIEDISGEGEFSWKLLGEGDNKRMELRVKGGEAELSRGQLKLPDGSSLELGRSHLRGVSLSLNTTAEGPEFDLTVEKASVDLAGGTVSLSMAGQRSEVRLAPMCAEGKVSISNDDVELDVKLSGVSLEVPESKVDLGVLGLHLTGLTVKGDGRFSGRATEGFDFAGLVEARGDLVGSSFNLEHLSAELASRSLIELRVTALATDPSGLSALSGSGQATLRLRSGSIPLGPKSQVHFSQGAEGTLQIDSVELPPEPGTWPKLEGKIQVRAVSEPISIRTFASLPSGEARFDAGVTMDKTGLLCLNDLDVALRTTGTQG